MSGTRKSPDVSCRRSVSFGPELIPRVAFTRSLSCAMLAGRAGGLCFLLRVFGLIAQWHRQSNLLWHGIASVLPSAGLHGCDAVARCPLIDPGK
jgi:hypothetical protein